MPFDDTVAAALRSGDPAALRAVDLALGAALLAAGTPAWRAAGTLLAGARYRADLLYAGAPYGVGYFVAFWTRQATDPGPDQNPPPGPSGGPAPRSGDTGVGP